MAPLIYGYLWTSNLAQVWSSEPATGSRQKRPSSPVLGALWRLFVAFPSRLGTRAGVWGFPREWKGRDGSLGRYVLQGVDLACGWVNDWCDMGSHGEPWGFWLGGGDMEGDHGMDVKKIVLLVNGWKVARVSTTDSWHNHDYCGMSQINHV